MRRLASGLRFLIVTLGLGRNQPSFADAFARCECWMFGVSVEPIAAMTLVREHASKRFGSAIGLKVAMKEMAMNEDVLLSARQFEALRLIKTFLRLTTPRRRQRVLELAEHLAEEAESTATASAFAATDASSADPARDVPVPTE
ncbi:hypothetical protein [Bradyrhizobium japonicum]|jgi:hypothetical protein|uniref:hypothetical protein n=1 Tax=Bradyrhizobium japonicum TaxID=375 RepID=UPI001FDA3D9C|nr:hypothetical protein [Bradyrhizobium japonicum]